MQVLSILEGKREKWFVLKRGENTFEIIKINETHRIKTIPLGMPYSGNYFQTIGSIVREAVAWRWQSFQNLISQSLIRFVDWKKNKIPNNCTFLNYVHATNYCI